MNPTAHRRRGIALPLLILLLPTLSAAGCAGAYHLTPRSSVRPGDITWFSPTLAGDQRVLDRWAAAVGPPVIQSVELPGLQRPVRRLAVVNWNAAIGSGDLLRLAADIRWSDPEAELVFLLQEVYRSGPDVPARPDPEIRYARRIGSGDRPEREIQSVARSLGANLYYVPSMRNGAPGISSEDRGNAILSTLPLTDLSAIELPFERQRRVAVAATVSGVDARGQRWHLRLVSAHLDNLMGAGRGWFAAAGLARARQARALISHLSNEPSVLLAGDFNTWSGFSELAFAELARALPDGRTTDWRPTFLGLMRLDHVFMRLPPGWTGEHRRAARRYGSDHYPLLGTLTLP